MKKFLFLTIFLCSYMLTFGQAKSSRYALKSGHVEYQLTGNTTGTKSVWWDDFGDKTYTEEKSVSVTRILGMTSREEKHQITVTIGEKFWSANLLDKTGQKGVMEYYQLGQEYADGLTDAEAKQLEEDVMDAFNGQRLGTENVLGNSCEVVEIMGVKSWIYKGVVLKSTGRVLGIEMNEMAKSFDKNCSVPPGKFSAPAGINYADITAMANAYYGQMEEEEDNDEDADLIPLSYPYSSFLSGIAPISQLGYKQTMTENADGQYMAVFMKKIMMGLTVVATSHKNMETKGTNDFSSYEKFSHNGNTCYYGQEEGTTVLAVDFKSKDMIVLFAPTLYQTKEQLLKVVDSCKF